MKPIQTQHTGLNQVGGRDNNEDFVYPFLPEMDINSELRARQQVPGLYLVCDGVGGASKGEVASRLTTLNFAHYFSQTPVPDPDKAYLDQGLLFVEGALSGYIAQHPSSQGMGTTLTLLHLGENQATIAWAGDSRVYHVRNGQILYQTEDHSLVNELIRQGQITAEEARNHHNKNIILRAIQGQENPTEVDMHVIPYTDIQIGDYFFLCTDGVEESITDEELAQLLGAASDPDEARAEVYKRCQGVSRDNFSCYIVEVLALPSAETPAPSRQMNVLEKITADNRGTVSHSSSQTEAIHAHTDESDTDHVTTELSEDDEPAGSSRRPVMRWMGILGFVVLIGLAGLGLKWVLDNWQKEPKYLAMIVEADLRKADQDFVGADTLYSKILNLIPLAPTEDSIRTVTEQKRTAVREALAVKASREEIDAIEKDAEASRDSYVGQQQAIEAYDGYRDTPLFAADSTYILSRIDSAKKAQTKISPADAAQELEQHADAIKANDTLLAKKRFLQAIELIGEGDASRANRLQTKLDSLQPAPQE